MSFSLKKEQIKFKERQDWEKNTPKQTKEWRQQSGFWYLEQGSDCSHFPSIPLTTHSAQSFQSKAGSCLLRLMKARAVYPYIPASWICRCVQLANMATTLFQLRPEWSGIYFSLSENKKQLARKMWNRLHTNHHQIHMRQTEIRSLLCPVPENRIILRQKIFLRICRSNEKSWK